MNANEAEICRLSDHALLRVTGADARPFLQAQTTQRIDDLAAGETRLAAWLTARGRVRALFDVVPEHGSFLLVLPADNRDYVIAELGRFVLRNDVTLSADPECEIRSLCGDVDAWLEARGLAIAPGAALTIDGLIAFRPLPDRVDFVGEPAALDARLGAVTAAAAATAELAMIRHGRPAIPAALRERYTPHMLNLERLDAVSFSKGCYPGQEIVARTENLGAAKRRILRFRTGAGSCPAAGDEIADASLEVVGEVNRSAPAAGGGFELLAVVPVETGGNGLALGTDGRALERLALPWE